MEYGVLVPYLLTHAEASSYHGDHGTETVRIWYVYEVRVPRTVPVPVPVLYHASTA